MWIRFHGPARRCGRRMPLSATAPITCISRPRTSRAFSGSAWRLRNLRQVRSCRRANRSKAAIRSIRPSTVTMTDRITCISAASGAASCKNGRMAGSIRTARSWTIPRPTRPPSRRSSRGWMKECCNSPKNRAKLPSWMRMAHPSLRATTIAGSSKAPGSSSAAGCTTSPTRPATPTTSSTRRAPLRTDRSPIVGAS